MAETYKNRQYVEQLDKKLSEALASLAQQIVNVGSQTGANPQSQSATAPAAPQSLAVSVDANGLFSATITDIAQQGKAWILQYSTTPNFVAATNVDLGTAQTWQATLKGKILYFRVYATFYTSPLSAPTYYGTPQNPIVVHG